MSKIERKFLAHFIAVGDTYVRLGQDLEEYSPELSATVEKTKNILGQTAVAITGYEKTAAVKPYFARVGDPLFDRLQAIIDGNLVLEELKTSVIEVKLWDGDDTLYPAVKEDAYIEINSYGGDTAGYQIPFTLHYTGVKELGSYDLSTGQYIPD